MNNLHELTKQLDVLTWNSRSVLNALIRSAMSAGSSKGFTVTRAGERLVLDKDDIYRIYHFYEAWEAAGFPNDPATFNALLDEENACYGDGTPVTDALVKHAKTVWMDSTNKDSSSTDDWLSRIYKVENPKWFTNTAPIPLNIRTPIYDENLSTKTYDSYETYLFPSGYYSIDTLGYIGDGTTHTAGGKNWTFDVTDVFRVSSDIARFGAQDDDAIDRLSSLYSTYKLKHAFEGGTNSFAFDRNAFSYGNYNQVNAWHGAALGGSSALVLGTSSGVFGGTSNYAVDVNSVIAGGSNNTIGSCQGGFAANSNNNVGGYSYFFSRKISASNTESACPDTLPGPEGTDCVYILSQLSSAKTPQNYTLGPTQIYIDHDTIEQSGMMGNMRISYGYYISTKYDDYSPFDFKIGDTVNIYGVQDANLYKKACRCVTATVVNIERVTNKGIVALNDTSATTDGYIVTLNKDFTANTFTDLGTTNISSGYVCRNTSKNYPVISSSNYFVRPKDLSSDNCSAIGYNLIAAGHAQVVAGASNTELLRPNFIVGCGTSYIGADDFHRGNSFVSAPTYTYSRATHYIVSGVSTVTTAYIHGDDDWDDHQEYDEDYFASGVAKYEGFYAYCMASDSADERTALLRVFNEKSVFAIGWTGLVLYEPKTDGNEQTKTVWGELRSDNGAIGIHSGSFLEDGTQDEDNNWLDFYNNYVRTTTTAGLDRTITVWAKDKTGIHGKQLMLHASEHSGYIDIQSMALRIRSNTREALTAQPTEHNINPFTQMGKRVDLIKDTGHVYTDKVGSGLAMTDIDLGETMTNAFYSAFHVFSSSKLLSYDSSTSKGTYDVAQLLLPGDLSPSCTRAIRGTKSMPHPIVIANKVIATDRGEGNNSREANSAYLYEELAYRSDIKTIGATILNNVATPAYSLSSTNYHNDTNPDVPGYNRASVQDTYLTSLMSASNTKFHYAHDVTAMTQTSTTLLDICRLRRVSSMTGVAAQMNTLGDITTNPEFFLSGVAINPGMRMIQVDGNNTIGVTYLALAPRSLASPTNAITNNLSQSTPTRTLYTSKFSPGDITSDKTDLCDVWAISVDNSHNAYWQPLLKNLIITVGGGHLCIEFVINGSVFNSGHFMPVKTGSVGNTAIVDDSASYKTFKEKDQVIILPIDPKVANNMLMAYNSNTGVYSQLHGRAYYTGNKNVSVTGTFSQYADPLKYNRTLPATMDTPYTFHGPYVTINMAGWGDMDLSGKEYYVCLEGAVLYAN